LQTDVANCGKCANACGVNERCNAGKCALQCGGDTPTECGRSCVDLSSNPQNCGKCGTLCPAGESCSDGKCALSCGGDTPTQCGQACVNTDTDSAHCGACGNACPLSQHCTSGKCTALCASEKLSLCADACVDLQSDDQNCGSCGTVCSDAKRCIVGECRTKISDVCAGQVDSCALLEGGDVVCFGSSYVSRPPDATRRIFLGEKAKQLSCSGFYMCAIGVSDQVQCWYGGQPQVIALPAGNPPLSIVGGYSESTCALLSDHTISCWQAADAPVAIDLPGAVGALGPSQRHWCARLTPDYGSKVYCWGDPDFAAAGEPLDHVTHPPTLIDVPAPTDPAIDFARSLRSSDDTSCAIGGPGELYCWGQNGGAFGQSNFDSQSVTPVHVYSNYGTEVFTSLANATGGGFCGTTQAGPFECWGAAYNKLGGSAATLLGSGVMRASTSVDHGLAVLDSGLVMSWGTNNGYSQLGRDDHVTYPEPCCGHLDEVP